jgi:hypothetical protein
MLSRSFSQYIIPQNHHSYIQHTWLQPTPPAFQDNLKQIESKVSLLKSSSSFLSPEQKHFTLIKIESFLHDMKVHLRQLDLEKQEIISKYEGKIAYIEEEQVESERKSFLLKDKVRILSAQLTQMRDEYNQLNEDFNSTMQLLKEQMNSREKAMDEEEDKIYKLNHLIQVLKEEIEGKDEEILNLKEKIEKNFRKITENNENPEVLLENLEKKYKSLEILYMQQMMKNNSLQENIQEIGIREGGLVEKVRDLEGKLKDACSARVTKDTSSADLSQGSVGENELLSGKVSWRFEATQLQSKVNELKQEISRLNKQNEDYKFEIIMLHNKISSLQASKKPEAILEVSEQLKSNDYDLTGTLEGETFKKPLNDLQTITEENYSELVKTVIIKNLVPTENSSDYEILEKTVDSLARVREVLQKHSELKREQPDLAKDLSSFIESKLEEKSYENRTVESRPLRIDDFEFQNYTEPSPRLTPRSPSSQTSHVSALEAKIKSKKKILLLHKEQIVCLKKQLREAEGILHTFQKLDIPMLKTLLWDLFPLLPKEDEKVEKEIELCLNLLNFSSEQVSTLKSSRGKKKFWLFG